MLGVGWHHESGWDEFAAGPRLLGNLDGGDVVLVEVSGEVELEELLLLQELQPPHLRLPDSLLLRHPLEGNHLGLPLLRGLGAAEPEAVLQLLEGALLRGASLPLGPDLLEHLLLQRSKLRFRFFFASRVPRLLHLLPHCLNPGLVLLGLGGGPLDVLLLFPEQDDQLLQLAGSVLSSEREVLLVVGSLMLRIDLCLNFRLDFFQHLGLVVDGLLLLGHFDDLQEQGRLLPRSLVRLVLQVLDVRRWEALDDQLVQQSPLCRVVPLEALERLEGEVRVPGLLEDLRVVVVVVLPEVVVFSQVPVQALQLWVLWARAAQDGEDLEYAEASLDGLLVSWDHVAVLAELILEAVGGTFLDLLVKVGAHEVELVDPPLLGRTSDLVEVNVDHLPPQVHDVDLP